MKRLGKTRRPTLERLEDRLVLTLPFGALPTDTAEYMLGDVLVNVVLMESQGAASTEDWTPALIQAAKDKAEQGMSWWVDTLRNYEQQLGITPGTNPLNFHFDYHFADNPVDTSHEPIAEVASNFDQWIDDFFTAAGISGSGTFHDKIREFNNDQRLASGDDWSFTIFVVNDDADLDGKFAYEQGGFSQAFAFAGGEFFITPAGRPVSTFAHETGHIFWAKDEYAGGSSYNDQRGYYNTQNTNALNDAPAGFVQQPSIMTAGSLMAQAFADNISAAPTLEMIGWRDADHDGLFDVLVPHSLTGSGYYDAANGEYHFLGASSVNTLQNQNSSGNQNDITINEIREVQYRFDAAPDDPWQTSDIPDGNQVDLDLTIGVPQGGFQAIEIRTYDSDTGVSSPVFQGLASEPTSTSTVTPRISGFVRYDDNNNGQADPGELGLSGWTVEIVSPDASLGNSIEPDDYAGTGFPIFPTAGTTVSAEPFLVESFVYAGSGNPASTGNSVFRYVQAVEDGQKLLSEAWNENVRLRFDFDPGAPTTYFQIDAVGNGGGDYARVEIYNASDQLLGRYTTGLLDDGEIETITLGRSEGDIAYAKAYGYGGTGVQFDNMHFGAPVSAVTDETGAFTLPYLPDGLYTLKLTPPTGGAVTGADSIIVPYAAGDVVSDVTFTGVMAAGQNPDDPYDVNADNSVNFGDILSLIADLRANGSHAVSEGPGASQPPFSDVNSDGQVDFGDILAVIAYLRNLGAGEAVSGGGTDDLNQLAGFADAGSDGTGAAGGGSSSSEPEADAGAFATGSLRFSPSGVSSAGNSTLTSPPFTLDTSLPAKSQPDFVPSPKPIYTFQMFAASQVLTVSSVGSVSDSGGLFDGGGLFGSAGGGRSAFHQSVDDAFASEEDFVDLLPSLKPLEHGPRNVEPSVHSLQYEKPAPNSRDARRGNRDERHTPSNEEADEADPAPAPGGKHEQAENRSDDQQAEDEQARDLIFRELERIRAGRERASSNGDTRGEEAGGGESGAEAWPAEGHRPDSDG